VVSDYEHTQQMAEAVRRQQEAATRSSQVDRTGWTDADWINDADRLMNEPDGAVTSLLNGHAMRMLRELERRGFKFVRGEGRR
jgi:hypothetical protein